MDIGLIFIAVVFVIAAVVAVVMLIDLQRSSAGAARQSMKNIVAAQRTVPGRPRGGGRASLFQVARESRVERTVSSRLTLRKKLKYAQWKTSPAAFRSTQLVISLLMCVLAGVGLNLNIVLQLTALSTGPILMGWLLNRRIERRYKAFDADYAPFLLSLVGLLKTGMNVMGALEAAAEGLEEGSLVRQEVGLMVERLRFGVSEDKSIGSFGEDIHHPEIELFVQALLLSRRVGGTLSDTLDRLAKQVRKRQFFRASANAAVGMQRGSIWLIIGILVGIEVYLYFVYPQAVTGAWQDEFGWQVWQFAIISILLGIFWVRQVTKIRT